MRASYTAVPSSCPTNWPAMRAPAAVPEHWGTMSAVAVAKSGVKTRPMPRPAMSAPGPRVGPDGDDAQGQPERRDQQARHDDTARRHGAP